jgi:hypothetical protein
MPHFNNRPLLGIDRPTNFLLRLEIQGEIRPLPIDFRGRYRKPSTTTTNPARGLELEDDG